MNYPLDIGITLVGQQARANLKASLTEDENEDTCAYNKCLLPCKSLADLFHVFIVEDFFFFRIKRR